MKPLINSPIRSISVVTVCLNTRDTIRLTLESVKRQSFPDVRHVIIDGVSTDGTLDIINEYKPAYLSSAKDKGIYDAMDKGAKAANGDLLIFLNAGDTFFDETVCEKVAAHAQESNADIIFGNLLPVKIKTSDFSNHGAFSEGEVLDLGYVRNKKFLYNESIHHQATFYRRWIFNDCTYYCPEEHATGEYNLLLDAVMTKNARVKYIPQTISRFALGGTSTHDFEKEWAKYTKARDTLRSLYMPDFEAIKLKSEFEFHDLKTIANKQSLKSTTKTAIKKSPFYKLYDRLTNSIVSRVTNRMNETTTQQIASVAGTLSTQINTVAHSLSERLENNQKQTETSFQSLVQRIDDDKKHVDELQAKMMSSLQALLEQTELNQKQTETTFQSLVQKIDDDKQHVDELRAKMMSALQSQNEVLQTAIKDLRHRFKTETKKTNPVLLNHIVQKIENTTDKVSLNVMHLADTVGAFKDTYNRGFSAFSQWNEDSILQYLVQNIDLKNTTFVEFGVGDYSEANTRLLLVKNGWSGLVLDNSIDRVTILKNDSIYWKNQLSVRCETVEPDNINHILQEERMFGDIGLLSIDIDGMDYWVWDAIDTISPAIVVCEYNALWGADRAVTVPYERGFDRTQKHYTWNYAGASLGALQHLGVQKGYTLICVNNGRNNAFFVRDDLLKASNIEPDEQPFKPSSFRDARNEDGSLSYLPPADLLNIMSDLELFDVKSEKRIKIGELSKTLTS